MAQKQQQPEGFSEEVLQALLKLSPLERAVVYVRTVEEMSYQEMAEIFECSEASLRKRHERAKKKLLGYLGNTLCAKRKETQNGTVGL